MRKLIELCNMDLTKATFKDVMFFSFAEGGAMGDAGAIVFYVKTGEAYYTNYVYGDADLNKVKELFPVFKECRFGMFGMGSIVPDGWRYVNLGMGNHLIVNDEVYEEFSKKIDVEADPIIIYQTWMKVADCVLNGIS